MCKSHNKEIVTLENPKIETDYQIIFYCLVRIDYFIPYNFK